MSEFLKAKLSTSPSPLEITVSPAIKGSNQIQMNLAPLPGFSIVTKRDGDSWQKFNATMSQDIMDTLINAMSGAVSSMIQDEAQAKLNQMASFEVPSVPISVDGVSLTLTPDNLAMTTHDGHLMVTGSMNVS